MVACRAVRLPWSSAISLRIRPAQSVRLVRLPTPRRGADASQPPLIRAAPFPGNRGLPGIRVAACSNQ